MQYVVMIHKGRVMCIRFKKPVGIAEFYLAEFISALDEMCDITQFEFYVCEV